MRTVGLSWTDWKAPWSSSSDEYVGTIAHLTEHLKEVLAAEQALKKRSELPCKSRALHSVEELHAQCPAPQMQRKTFKSLGPWAHRPSKLQHYQLTGRNSPLSSSWQKLSGGVRNLRRLVK